MFAGKSKNVQDVGFRDFFSAKSYQLIEHRFCVAQSAFRSARDGMRRGRFEHELFLDRDELQMFRDQVGRDAVQIKPLASTQNCRQNLFRLGRGEDKFHVLAAVPPAS